MKPYILIFMLLALAAVSNAQGKFGLGVIIGEPTGISMKYKMSQTSAVDGAVAWSFGKYEALQLHADYLHNFAQISGEVSAYVGVGGRIKVKDSKYDDEMRLSVRIPVGLVFEPSSTPIDVFIEIVPVLNLNPKTDFDGNAAIGIRYFFN